MVPGSPTAAGFVEVSTPKPHDPQTQDAFDANGVQLGEWSSELKESDLRSPYYWQVCACPCVPMAQIEKRLGVSTYGGGLCFYGASFTAFFLFALATVIWVFSAPATRCYWTPVFLIIAMVAQMYAIASRIASTRTQVRARFHIPGTEREDRRAAWLQTSRVIRQMGKHLKCDRVKFSSGPATLPAYEV